MNEKRIIRLLWQALFTGINSCRGNYHETPFNKQTIELYNNHRLRYTIKTSKGSNLGYMKNMKTLSWIKSNEPTWFKDKT